MWAPATSLSLFADLRSMIQDYQKAVSVFAGIIRFVFLKQPAFSHVLSDKDKVSPETLQVWKDSAGEKLEDWVADANIRKDVESCLIQPLAVELKALFSAGLDSVAPVVQQLLGGLLGAGLSKGVSDDLMMKVPSQHPLRALVQTFAEARLTFFFLFFFKGGKR